MVCLLAVGCGDRPVAAPVVPEKARAQHIKGMDDITYWHQRLVECYITVRLGKEERDKVREMLHFFAFAIQRAAEFDFNRPISEHEAAASLFSDRSVPKLFTSAMTGSPER